MHHTPDLIRAARERFDVLVEKQKTEGLTELEVAVKALLIEEFKFEPKPEVRKYNDFCGY